ELAEETSDDVSHEQQRNQHRDQRNRERDDGEPDLPRSFQRRVQRRISGLQIAVDVFDHDDGVIHHKAGGDGQCHQRQIVQAVSQQVHHAKRAHDGEWNRDAGNKRGPQVSQEKENYNDHQHDGQRQLELNIFHRRTDRGGPVSKNLHFHGRGQRRLQLRQQFLDAIHHADDVRSGLALDVHDDRRNLVHPCREPRVFRAVNYIRYIAQSHGSAVAISDDDRLVLGGGKKLIVGANRVGLARAIDYTLGLIHIRLGQSVANIFQAQAVRSERRRIYLNSYRGLLPAAD